MRLLRAFLVLLLMLPGVVVRAAEAPVPAALAGLEPGNWDLRSRDPGDPVLHLCVHDFLALVQVRHPGQSCTRLVVEDTADRATIAYACPRTGHGRTAIRVETPRLVQIDSQGVADGYPFALDMEARRTGACAMAERK